MILGLQFVEHILSLLILSCVRLHDVARTTELANENQMIESNGVKTIAIWLGDN